MSGIKNGGLDQYGIEPFERQQFRTAGVEGVNVRSVNSVNLINRLACCVLALVFASSDPTVK